jgi:hypothetical protein
MKEKIYLSPEEIVLNSIHLAYDNGFNVDDPDNQISPTIRTGVKRLRENKPVTPEDIADIEKMGGTDHPDPWVS